MLNCKIIPQFTPKCLSKIDAFFQESRKVIYSKLKIHLFSGWIFKVQVSHSFYLCLSTPLSEPDLVGAVLVVFVFAGFDEGLCVAGLVEGLLTLGFEF